LTSGNPEVKDLINVHTVFNVKEANSDDLFLYKILYNAEKNSEHPIAQSICKHILNFL
jgi:cation transport ATPase